jgi:ComF family protein
VSWGHYQDSLRRLLHQLKYENQTAIANLFGQLLAQAWQQQQLPQCAVIPIPLHASKQTQRGYNQAELIARQFCQFTGMRCYPQLLQRTKATQAQHGLSQSQRLTNLQSAFSTTDHRHLAAPILLIDDIYTTGATIQAATHCLHQGGYQVWGTLVVAR